MKIFSEICDKEISCMTSGIREVIARENTIISEAIAKWCVEAGRRISKYNPDFIVGRPGIKEESLEDNGRTLILPLPIDCPKCYVTFNETGGITFMLADEY